MSIYEPRASHMARREPYSPHYSPIPHFTLFFFLFFLDGFLDPTLALSSITTAIDELPTLLPLLLSSAGIMGQQA